MRARTMGWWENVRRAATALLAAGAAACGSAPPMRSGTCFFVSPSVALTSLHVVHDRDRVLVRDAKGVWSAARTIARDEELDLAVMQVGSGAHRFLSIASDDAGIGDHVFTIGAWTHQAAAGLIVGDHGLGSESLLSTTTAVAPGSSGGPLVNGDGEVIGLLVRLKVTNQIAFAVKSSRIRRSFQTLAASAATASLGSSTPGPDAVRDRTRGAVCAILVR